MFHPIDRGVADDVGKALLRFAVGGPMLLHGVSKLAHGVDGIARRFVELGLPGALAYGALLGEVVAPILLLLGVLTRIAGALVAATMVVAVALVHSADVFSRNPRTGAWAIELQALYLFGAVAVVLMGSGRYGLSRGRGRWD